MPPSRRHLLRATGVAIAGLSGCSTLGGTSTGDDTPSARATATRSETQNPTDGSGPATLSPCGHGPAPDDGWPLPECTPGRTNYAATATGPTETPTAAWTVTAAEPERGDVRFTRPLVDGDRAYVGRRIVVGTEVPEPDRQFVHAYDTETGDRLWRASVPGRPRPVGVDGGAVLVVEGQTLYAFETETGATRWTDDAGDQIEHVARTRDGLLVASTDDRTHATAFAMVRDGDRVWRTTVPHWIDSKIAWVGERAYFGTPEGVLVAFDAEDRAVAWTRDLQDDDDTSPVRVAATPCAVFAAVDGVVSAVRTGGEIAWTEEHGFRDLATDGDRLYGVTGAGYVRAVAIADGSQQWEQFRGVEESRYTDGFYDGLAVDSRTLYAGTIDDQLVAIATADGRMRWVLERDWDGITVSVVDDTLYAAWGDRLLAFR